MHLNPTSEIHQWAGAVTACQPCVRLLGEQNPCTSAGSERQKRSGAVGDRLKEANSINLSLSTLGRVIKGICEGQRTPPFRESALTRLLQVLLP